MSPFKSSSGLPEHIAAALCYLFSFVGGIVFLAVERRSQFVMFHALQSVIFFCGMMIIHVIFGFIPLIGPLIASLLSILTLVMWVVLVVNAFQGRWFRIPLIGDIAESQLRHL
ncbi:DUF4870 domain-containing protein [Paenibacillus macquariensis]|uniref:Uncharacterized membrane protein n=1 Tax=Paenibacillus macquariensis TaxID=948756 RepID=A0ABY1K915_9BACL|nr:DUF4870 domain-containing protein [Paenibacillus macquariensis]MEC0091525.1 DUF4870 domain-containing protein [Paenibacillus macquariensis]OAB26657.1 hypothetical protein PMSM_26175 [Paenibacillus macquariensis subsp. macquariensis]SIR44104.1 Uncharacterized membrane protein [Paenibacillus macquariensis]